MTAVLAAGQFYQVKLFAGRRVAPGSPASTRLERQDKNKFHKQCKKKKERKKKNGHFNGNKVGGGRGIRNVFGQVCHVKAQE